MVININHSEVCISKIPIGPREIQVWSRAIYQPILFCGRGNYGDDRLDFLQVICESDFGQKSNQTLIDRHCHMIHAIEYWKFSNRNEYIDSTAHKREHTTVRKLVFIFKTAKVQYVILEM